MASAVSLLENVQSGHAPLARLQAQCLTDDHMKFNASHPQQHSEGWMAKTPEPNPRTKADCIEWLKDKRAIAKEVRLALVSDFDHLRAPNKEIAKEAGCSHRTVEAWTDREVPTLPGLEHFLRLIPKSASIQKLLLQLMTLDADQHLEYARVLSELRRLG